ncbi:hypothetical protein L7F22_008373, partial [Adiantum nelumboides]|nr:hypothetical protein [Adiantum nelumboides]
AGRRWVRLLQERQGRRQVLRDVADCQLVCVAFEAGGGGLSSRRRGRSCSPAAEGSRGSQLSPRVRVWVGGGQSYEGV